MLRFSAVPLRFLLAMVLCDSIVAFAQDIPKQAETGQAKTPQKPDPLHVRFRDGKVLVAYNLWGWHGSKEGLSFYTPRSSTDQFIEILLDAKSGSYYDSGNFLLRIPFEKLHTVVSLPKQKDGPADAVDLEFVNGGKVSGVLRGTGWTGRTKSDDGFEQTVTIKNANVRGVTIEPLSPNIFQATIEETQGSKTVLSTAGHLVGGKDFGVGEQTLDELSVGVDEKTTKHVPVAKIKRMQFTDGEQAPEVLIDLEDGKTIRGPLRSGLYLNGKLSYGTSKDLHASLFLRPRVLSHAIEEVVRTPLGTVKASEDSGLDWAWPKATPTTTKNEASKSTKTPDKVAVPKLQIQPKQNDDDKARGKLDLAKGLIKNNKTDLAKKRLTELIESYPNTTAATEAKKLLVQLQ